MVNDGLRDGETEDRESYWSDPIHALAQATGL